MSISGAGQGPVQVPGGHSAQADAIRTQAVPAAPHVHRVHRQLHHNAPSASYTDYVFHSDLVIVMPI